jgi:hypothetical protein
MAANGDAKTFDFFVIGGGSGGLAAAKQAADLGAKVAVADYVDPSWAGSTWGLGGTCLNVGCIPKKLFHTAAIHREQHVLAAALGWDTKATHNWETMVENVNMYIKKQVWGHKTDLRSKKVTYLNSIAVFGEKTADGLFSIELYKGLPTKGGEFVEKATTSSTRRRRRARPSWSARPTSRWSAPASSTASASTPPS